MAKINFFLKEPQKDSTIIYMSYNYSYQRIKVSTGIKIPTQQWITNSQRVNYDFHQATEINRKLDKMRQVLESLILKYKEQGIIPTGKKLKEEFVNMKGVPAKSRSKMTFWDHFFDFVEYKIQEVKSPDGYRYCLWRYLLAVEKKMGVKLTFSVVGDINSGFAEAWSEYLTYEASNNRGEEGLSVSTIGKQNKNLKVFLNWCFDRNITERFSLKAYPTMMEDTDKVYLTEDELNRLEAVKVETDEERNVLDLFLIACETGLRFSDFKCIDPEDIVGGTLHVRPMKTRGKRMNNKIIIPISDRVQVILNRYNHQLPQVRSNCSTEFNKVLRKLCQRAGLDDLIVNYKMIAGKERKQVKKKFEEISSHTGRRTFCTLKFLKGMPAQAIMKFSGHTTERNFLRYLRLDAVVTAEKYKDFF